MDDRAQALRQFAVSRETERRLDAFVAMLRTWQARTNLVAPSTLPLLWTRHVADSLQLLQLAPHATRWLDIGSGGGFPGMVLACVLADVPGARVHLVERVGKKAAFLREALRVTGGAGIVHAGDIADCAAAIPADIDVVTARAVASLADLLDLTSPWLSRNITGLFPKGQDVEAEIEEATRYSIFNVRRHPSLTGNGQIIEVISYAGRRHPAD
jgi:16S rRNA (guanine527-N7)-methyltransferase